MLNMILEESAIVYDEGVSTSAERGWEREAHLEQLDAEVPVLLVVRDQRVGPSLKLLLERHGSGVEGG